MSAVNSSRVSFASCNRQDKPQHHWLAIGSLKPSHFFWTGDAVYAKGNSLARLKDAFSNLTANKVYSKFAESVSVDGIWDDHDYGINDAGKYCPDKLLRQYAFSDFIGSSIESGAGSFDGPATLYHHTDISFGHIKARFYFLDTRSMRENHWIRSLGELHVKGSALVASALRATYSVMGLGRKYDAEILGHKQWEQLEQSLRSSEADVNVIISSIQILTTNPVFESWGHFPVEKQRLFDLLRTENPPGLAFISGDVHLGEVSKATFTRKDGTVGEWVEVTSSGLTHTCADGMINRFLCPFMMSVFSKHRYSKDSLFLGTNFGIIEESIIDATPSGTIRGLNVSVYSVDTVESVMSYVIAVPANSDQTPQSSPIMSVSYPDFPVLPMQIRVLILVVLVVLPYFLTLLLRKRRQRQRQQQKQKTKRH